jgi:site-specific DNA-cytosine methylase
MGWETVAFVERDKFCQRVLRKNFGQDIEIHDDITTFSGKPFRGRVDVVTGGFPCQPFSAAGQRRGVDDERYLFPESLRVVREVQPAWVVLENVNGLLSMADESWDVKVASQFFTRTPELHDYQAIFTRTEVMLLNRICEAIEREGYSVQPIVVPASAIGARHERKRVWIVAKSSGVGCNDRGDYRRERHLSGQPRRCPKGESKWQRRKRGTCSTGSISTDTQDAGTVGRERITPDDPATSGDRGDDGRNGDGATWRQTLTNPNSERLQRRNGAELRKCADEWTSRPRSPSVSHPSIEGLPNWAGGALGQPAAVTEFERPGGREIERDFRGVAHGVSKRVDRLKSLGNSIVPQIAFEIFKAIEQTESAQIKGLVVKR